MNPRPDWARRAWLLYVVAVASSIPTLWFYLVGEEGILVNSSLEMAQRGDWLRLWFYGNDAMHGVFANWLIILACKVIGWEHAPAAGRLVMMVSTAVSGLIAAYLAQRLYRNAVVTALAAAITVTFADILLYRGWLGYRDPLLAMLVFGAVAALWLAVHTRQVRWLWGTLLFSSAAFLTKGIIAYAFVGAAALVFLLQRDGRSAFLRPLPVLIAAMTLCMPLVWSHWVVGDQSHSVRLASEIGTKLMPQGIMPYLWKWVAYPLETLLRLAPLSLLALWWAWRRRLPSGWIADPYVRTALIIATISFVPFWLAPQSHFRYVLPITPLLAMVLATVISRMNDLTVRMAFRWLWAAVALKLVLAVVLFPLYQHQYRGENYAAVVREVLQRTGDAPLYSNDVSAAGLSVTAYINLRRLPRPVLTFAPVEWSNGFVLFNAPDQALGKVAAQFRLAGDTIYLLCRGAACELSRPR